jgi:hypothetical protein
MGNLFSPGSIIESRCENGNGEMLKRYALDAILDGDELHQAFFSQILFDGLLIRALTAFNQFAFESRNLPIAHQVTSINPVLQIGALADVNGRLPIRVGFQDAIDAARCWKPGAQVIIEGSAWACQQVLKQFCISSDVGVKIHFLIGLTRRFESELESARLALTGLE